MTRLLFSLLFATFLCTCTSTPVGVNASKAGRAPENTPAMKGETWDEFTANAAFTIRSGKHEVAVYAANGGRLGSYTINGKEVLKTTRDADGWQWGSTVWSSPQTAWNWPPEKTFDAERFDYTAQSSSSVTLQSGIDPVSKLQLEKTFAFSSEGKAGLHLKATYRLINRGTEPVGRGLWENTRVPYSGEFSFVADSIRLDKLTGDFDRRGAATVINMTDGDTEKGKLFIHPNKGKATYAGNGVRLRKLWFLEDAAPGQAPLEIYLAPAEGFAEFEVQGGYRVIPPGESITLSVAWQVAELTRVD